MNRYSTTLAMLAVALLLPLGLLAAEPAAKGKKVDKQCESTATTRIRKIKTEDCARFAQGMRTYTKQDLESTGQTDMAEALRRLDPRFH